MVAGGVFCYPVGRVRLLDTLGGTGQGDMAWTAAEDWRNYSRKMDDAALVAMDAAKTRNKTLLGAASRSTAGLTVEVAVPDRHQR